MFSDPNSAFWFYGRLHPVSKVPPFQAEEIEVEDKVRLEVVWDGIGVWSRPGTKRFKQPGEAAELFGLVVAAYALLTGEALDFSSDGWVEAKNAHFDGTILGFQARQMKSSDQVNKNSEESIALQSACSLAVVLRRESGYRLGLRDIYSSLREVGNDAFFYAYRAIETVARYALDCTDLEAAQWKKFHSEMGIDPGEGRARLKPLKAARDALAHGDEGATAIGEAARQRRQLLDVARWFVITAFEKSPALNLPDLTPYKPWSSLPRLQPQ